MKSIKAIITGLTLLTIPAAAQAAPTLTLRPSFAPNPSQIRGRTQLRDQSLRRVFRTKSNCSGYVASRPDAVVNLPRGLGRATMHFAGMGQVHIKLPNNRYICGSQKITMNPWPAGRLEIRSRAYWGSRARVGNFTITVEDPARRRNLGWKRNALKKIALTKHLAKPILVSGTARPVSRISSRRSRYCNNVQVPNQPILLLTVDRPLTNIRYRLKSGGRARVVVIGPLNKSNRNIPTRCPSYQKMGRLEPGTYAIKVGIDAGYGRTAQPATYTLVLHTPNTKLSPLEAVANIPKRLTVRQRIASRFYPQLPKGYYRSTAMLQALYAVAPKHLFVFASFDYDKASATFKPVWDYKNKTYPRKNEPLLLVGNRWATTADGTIFEVKRYSYLKPNPSAPITMPRRARNPHESFRKAVEHSGPKDQRSIRSYNRARKRNRKCGDRIWRSANRRIRIFRQRAWSRWRARQILNIKRRTNRRVDNACGWKRLKRTQKRLHSRLMRTRTKRRTKRLKKIRLRMLRMFP